MPYCPKCGKLVHEDDRFCSKCGTPQHETGSKLIEDIIDIEYPESTNLTLEIQAPVSRRLRISKGGSKLVEGTILYDIPEWIPRIQKTSDRITIKQTDDISNYLHFDNPKNDWNLQLGTTKPYNLRVKTGVSRGTWNLGGLPLTELRIETGVGENKVYFKEPNPTQMNGLRIRCGVGQIDIYQLLNANSKDYKIEGGVGAVILNFTGSKPQQDTRVKVDGGIGGFEIEVQEDVSAIFKVTGLNSVTTRGSINTRRRSFGSGEYSTETYETERSAHVMSFDITLGLGGLTLRTVKG